MARSTSARSCDSSRKRERQDDEGSDSDEEDNADNGDEDGEDSGQDSASDISQRGVRWSSDDTSSLSRTEDERDMDNDEADNDDNKNEKKSADSATTRQENGKEDTVMEGRANEADDGKEVVATPAQLRQKLRMWQ
jgi:hypothetical protein